MRIMRIPDDFKNYWENNQMDMSLSEIAKHFGVASTTIISWCKRLGLPPKRKVFRRSKSKVCDIREDIFNGLTAKEIGNKRGVSKQMVHMIGKKLGESPKIGYKYSFSHDEALKLYNEGLNDKEIAKKLNSSCGTVLRWRHKSGLKTNYRFFTNLWIKEAIELKQQGVRNCDIARKLNKTPLRVWQVLNCHKNDLT